MLDRDESLTSEGDGTLWPRHRMNVADRRYSTARWQKLRRLLPERGGHTRPIPGPRGAAITATPPRPPPPNPGPTLPRHPQPRPPHPPEQPIPRALLGAREPGSRLRPLQLRRRQLHKGREPALEPRADRL